MNDHLPQSTPAKTLSQLGFKMRAFHPFVPENLKAKLEKFDAQFFNLKALHLEIGCGVGLHPIQWAQQNPSKTLIAIEHTQEKFQKFARRVAHHSSLNNLHPVHCNAISFLPAVVPDASLEQIVFMYPNPFPKDSQRQKRWYMLPFVSELKRALKPEGKLYLATNIKSYAEEWAFVMQSAWGFKLIDMQALRLEPHQGRTHFERKYLKEQQECYEVILKN